jgi:hypothetical protein
VTTTTKPSSLNDDPNLKIDPEQCQVKAPPHLTPPAHSLLRGLLEKNAARRLGCMKSTMFTIGGVAALKQHEFFADYIDFDLLFRKEVTPPIDVSFRDDNRYTAPGEVSSPRAFASTTAGGGAGNGNDNGIKGGCGGQQQLQQQVQVSSDSATGMVDTRWFHEGYTEQQLRPSMVEDAEAGSRLSTPSSTPGGISRPRSRIALDGLEAAGAEESAGNSNNGTCTPDQREPGAQRFARETESLFNDFDDFNYVEPAFKPSQARVDAFNASLAAKLTKLQKKKLYKQKLEQERIAKASNAAELLAAEAAQQESRARQAAVLRQQQEAAAEAARRKREEEEAHAAAAMAATAAWKKAQDQWEAHSAEVEAAQKKARNLRKKLSAVREVEARMAQSRSYFVPFWSGPVRFVLVWITSDNRLSILSSFSHSIILTVVGLSSVGQMHMRERWQHLPLSSKKSCLGAKPWKMTSLSRRKKRSV